MRRYQFLPKDSVYEALNKLRDAFLAAKDGSEVDQIIYGLLTHDERVKIGRRILIAECLEIGMNLREITDMLKVGKNTVASVIKTLENDSTYFALIMQRSKKVTKEYTNKKYREIGGVSLVHKAKQYTGFKRKDVKR